MDLQTTIKRTDGRTTPANSTYPKVAVQWLNQAFPQGRDRSCFYQSLCLVDSEVLRNRHLRQARKRYQQGEEKTATTKMTDKEYISQQAERFLNLNSIKIETATIWEVEENVTITIDLKNEGKENKITTHNRVNN